MSKRSLVVGAIVVLLIAAIVPQGVFAQSATGQAWSTSITYYTPSDTGGTLYIHYYAEGSDVPIDAAPITLSGHKAGSLFIGNVTGMDPTFEGGAVLEADVPIVATAVNIAQTGPDTNYARPLYTGFDPAAASQDFFIPTVLYQKFGYTTSEIGIQNIGTTAIDATLKVYPLGGSTPAFQQTYPIKGQSSQVVSAADMASSLGANFTGSAVIEATGPVVASAQETADSGRAAKAFEGVASTAGATTIYMASMMCNAYGAQMQTSYYAIQNVDTAAQQAQVQIEFYNTAGTLLYTTPSITIDAGNKASANPCQYTGSAPALAGAVGSAVIKSTNGVPLIAMGKVKGVTLTETAFVGQSMGATNVAAPYIRWKADPAAGERSYVAVMNVGTAPTTYVHVRYYNTAGLVGTAELGAVGKYIKANTNPSTAAVLDANGDFGVNPYGGAIEVEADQPVIVVVRVQKAVGADVLGEDYNGVPVP